MVAQPVVVGSFAKQPHFRGSELFGWPETSGPAEMLVQRWSHSEVSGAMINTFGAFRAWSFGPS